MKNIFLKTIRLYQKTFSPDHGMLKDTGLMKCRFYPSCSEYGYRAIDTHGIVKGSILTLWRIVRCSPLSEGGYDPVHKQNHINKLEESRPHTTYYIPPTT
jgi:uncharacterized protein